MRARGLRRSEASICSIAMSGWPASILSTPLANHPRVVRVERQGTINQRHHGTDILAEISQRVGDMHQDDRVVVSYFQGSPGEISALQAVRRRIFAPVVIYQQKATVRR